MMESMVYGVLICVSLHWRADGSVGTNIGIYGQYVMHSVAYERVG